MNLIRVCVLKSPFEVEIVNLPTPRAAAGQVVINVARVGVCGTDLEFYSGQMQYLHDGHAQFPLRLGHEWCGTVTEVGEGVSTRWRGKFVTGDTMLGCGSCLRCVSGRHHVCEQRYEVGIRGGFPGALAQQLVMPVSSLHQLPADLDPAIGAMVEPGANSWRAVAAAKLKPGHRVLIIGPGTIGLLAGFFARAQGADVHFLGRESKSLTFARGLGFERVWNRDNLPCVAFDAVIDASNSPEMPALAVNLVEPGKRVVLIGLATTPSHIDSRLLALKDITVVGVLSASAGLAPTIAAFASGQVDPRPLIAACLTLDEVGSILAGHRPIGAGDGPKFQIDPQLN